MTYTYEDYLNSGYRLIRPNEYDIAFAKRKYSLEEVMDELQTQCGWGRDDIEGFIEEGYPVEVDWDTILGERVLNDDGLPSLQLWELFVQEINKPNAAVIEILCSSEY